MEQPIQGVQEWRHPLTHTYGFRKPKFSLKWGNAPIKSYDGGKAFKSQVAVPPLQVLLPYYSLPLSLTHSFIHCYSFRFYAGYFQKYGYIVHKYYTTHKCYC